MKQFIVDRHTTPNTPTLEQVPTEKIPIYENRAAVTADLANLSVGQIVATKDTGNELAQPVDVVEEDNLHAVTSNAVAESLSYSETEQKTGGYWIDGKPIYRKTVYIASTSSGVLDISSMNIDTPITVVNAVAYKYNDVADKQSLPLLSGGTRGGISFQHANLTVTRGDASYNYGDIYITLEYTKN